MAKQTRSAGSKRKAARNAERRKRVKKNAKAVLGLPILHADTAGIDIGATEIYVDQNVVLQLDFADCCRASNRPLDATI
jgi:hypothetical protein